MKSLHFQSKKTKFRMMMRIMIIFEVVKVTMMMMMLAAMIIMKYIGGNIKLYSFISENKVAEQKAQKKLGLAGTETPIGPPSGDEAEVEQWNKDSEAPRGKDVHDETDEDSSGGGEGSGDCEMNSEDIGEKGTKEEGKGEAIRDSSENISDETGDQKT